MSFLRRNNKPKPLRPPVDLTWRRPLSGVAIDPSHTAEALGAFQEDALSLADARTARDRSEELAHVS